MDQDNSENQELTSKEVIEAIKIQKEIYALLLLTLKKPLIAFQERKYEQAFKTERRISNKFELAISRIRNFIIKSEEFTTQEGFRQGGVLSSAPINTVLD